MNSFKLSLKLFKDNIKVYKLYLLITIVSVATLYNFLAIENNDAFTAISERFQAASVASLSCGFILVCTVIYFIFNADEFFLLNRKKETALYMLMGITQSKIGQVFAIESLLLGVTSMVSGLAFGVISSKLFFMLLAKSISLNVEIPFKISLNSIFIVILVFTCIFGILGYKKYRVVKKSKLIDMINATREKENLQKLRYFKGILGVLLILAGYLVGVMIKRWDLDLIFSSMTALLCVSIGTYFFFGSFMSIVFNKMIKNKNIVYKNVRLVSISNVYFRLKGNYRNLAMTAILCAAAITAFGVSLSFEKVAQKEIVKESPYSFSYESNDEKLKEKVVGIINESNHKLIGINENKFFLGKIDYINYPRKVDYNNEAIIISYSTLKKNLEFLNYKVTDNIKPKGGEAVFIISATTLASPLNALKKEIKIKNREYVIKKQEDVPFTGIIEKLGKKNIYVLEDYEYKKVKEGFNETSLNCVQISKEKEANQLLLNISKVIKMDKIYPHIKEYTWDYYAIEIFHFLGLIMSIIFIISTFSTIYFKILKDAFMDKEQYKILKKIGMSKVEVKRSVYVQVGISFILPGSVGILHSIIAMKMLEQIMNFSFNTQLIIAICLYSITMILFYFFISNNYVKMVYEEGDNNA
ncbi:FtsX-like permease family protein [Clostridium estertheticum]|uniref:ABC transporter permease n=1 Tax=Clostridium estertheticum subsp. estertheticum TaxID=1552 RepID=A0A1J0GC76_9CLOT|nr:ABC transporter permease [Clostridium estertheticum]APC38937.1 ABC transporter permease [Clostridium estertheticum subsp. estertheticum]MBZ9615112.1 ABC transporter permease [Clostridium estertheticum subsp. laramiense]WAG75010.1 ABC transporter permease [Clostridium estertheticum]